jgi:hypothetical protein
MCRGDIETSTPVAYVAQKNVNTYDLCPSHMRKQGLLQPMKCHYDDIEANP